jgi:hypothetical protein
MKDKVLELLKSPPEQASEYFNKALDLFRQSPKVPQRQLSHFNSLGFSNSRLHSLVYELMKAHGITQKDVLLYNPAPEVPIGEIEVKSLELVPGAGNGPEGESIIGKTLVAAGDVFVPMSDEVKEDVKLRDEFPFLMAEDCPDEFKILTADKLTHYHKWVEAHKQLLVVVPAEGQEPVAMSPEEIFVLAKKAIENFTANQDIYAELEHFRNTGKILGQHPIFRRKKMQESVDKLQGNALTKRQSNLINYRNRTNKELEKTTDPVRVEDLKRKLEAWQEELDLVNAKIDGNDKK